jgi:ParB-like chromosome segregation protein Spo0J
MPVVLPEMEQLLPPLSTEQFSTLESDILENGCYNPIIVNEDMVIVDGHNRFHICKIPLENIKGNAPYPKIYRHSQ